MLKQMKETNNKLIANAVGAGLVSAQKEKTINKSIANAVGVAPQGDPQTKNIKDKLIANVVGADDPVCPVFEEQTQNKNFSKEHQNLTSQKGITLIALVITIIIMLILVTVTITVALKGELFNTAKQAKTETENKINEEQNLASGKVEIDRKEYGSIDEYLNGKKLTAKDLTVDDYGEYVDYGLDLNGDRDTTNDWKIFYVGSEDDGYEDTNGRIFIIAADLVTGDKCEALKTAIKEAKMTQNTVDSSEAHEYCYYWISNNTAEYHCNDGHNKSLNANKTQCSFPEIFMSKGYYCSGNVGIDGKGGFPNSRCASNLMCTDNWKSFIDDSSKKECAEYAIGGPTVEMWIASWNKKHGNSSDTTKPLYWSNNSTNGFGYCVGLTQNPTGSSVFGKDFCGSRNEGYNDRLYFTDVTKYVDAYWLSSPSSYLNYNIMTVDKGQYGFIMDDNLFQKNGVGLRPLVCLKSDAKLTKVLNDDGSVAYYSLSK